MTLIVIQVSTGYQEPIPWGQVIRPLWKQENAAEWPLRSDPLFRIQDPPTAIGMTVVAHNWFEGT